MIVDIISALILFIILTSINVSVIYIYGREIKWFFNEVYSKSLKRSTPLQKEIKAERKEIEIMEKLKVDIEKLDQLRERRKILFAETHEEELITANDVEPLKQPDAMEKRIRELINFSFDVQDKLLEERRKDFERMQREAEEEIDEVINHYKEKLDRSDSDEQ